MNGAVRSGALPGHDPAIRLHRAALSRRAAAGRRCGARSPARFRPASSRRKLLIDALSRFQNEQRSIEYVKLDAAQAGTIDPPSPETLAAYFDDHKTQFRAPEYRKISFVVINPEEIGKWTDVSDEDARKVFEQRRDRLGTPEKREVSQIVFPNAEEALAARSRIAGGLSFEDLAKERGLNPSDVDLGLIAKSAIIDPAIADAAFSLPSGEVSQPVQGKFGVALVKIGKIEPGVEPTYESVAARPEEGNRDRARARQGRRSAATRWKTSAAAAPASSKPRRSSGSPPSPSMPSIAPAACPTASRWPTFRRGLDVVSQAFNSDVGVDNDPIQFNGGYVWYDVLGITPSRERTLDEVKDQVEARWRDDQITSRLRTKATEMVQKLEQGGKLADEAAAVGLKVETAAGFSRDASLPGVPAGVDHGGVPHRQGRRRTDPGAGGSEWIVFRVTDVTRAAGRSRFRRDEEAEGDACSAG